MQKQDTGSILILMFVLAFAVVAIDERFLRTAVAFVPGLLLMQRAMSAGESTGLVGAANRRFDSNMRDSVDELLKYIREFYLTCHMIGTGKMTSDEAIENASEMEGRLNQLLARVTEDARTKSKRGETSPDP